MSDPIARPSGSPKRDFTVALLRARPETTPQDLGAAWRKAGNKGAISANIYYLAKRELAREQEAVTQVQTIPATNGRHTEPVASAPVGNPDLEILLWDLEERLDRMIFAIMRHGEDFPNRENLEGLLRSARRQVIYASKDL